MHNGLLNKVTFTNKNKKSLYIDPNDKMLNPNENISKKEKKNSIKTRNSN